MNDHQQITAERGRRAADLRAAAVALLEQQSIAAGVMLDLDSDQVVAAGPKAAILYLLSNGAPAATSGDAPANECQHNEGEASYTHWNCLDCGAIKTDGGWGIASRKWFPSVDVAKFYQQHGRMPEPVARIESAAAPAPTAGALRALRELEALADGDYKYELGAILAPIIRAKIAVVEHAAAPATAWGDELPPLPEAFGQIEIYGDEDCAVRVRSVDGFTADQMRDYARAAVSAATKPTDPAKAE